MEQPRIEENSRDESHNDFHFCSHFILFFPSVKVTKTSKCQKIKGGKVEEEKRERGYYQFNS